MSAKLGEIWKKSGLRLMVLVEWEMIADSNSHQNFLQRKNLSKVT